MSRFTVARRLHKGGLFALHPKHCLPLTVGQRCRHLEWCKEHKIWTSHQWSHVLFMDVSRFSATSNSLCHLAWREVGTRFYPRNIVKKDHYGGPGVLSGGDIMNLPGRNFASDLPPHFRYTLCNQRSLLSGGNLSPCASVPMCHWSRFPFYG